jgi:hypothetical protein
VSAEDQLAEFRRLQQLAKFRQLTAQKAEPAAEETVVEEAITAPEEQQGLLSSALETVANTGRTALSGAVPFYSQGIAGARSLLDPSTYGEGRDIGERYDLALEQEKGGKSDFRAEHPLTSIAVETAGGFASPLNKLGPVTQTGTGFVNALKGTADNVLRNASEAALYGYGENGIEGALDAAQTGAAFTAGLDSLGRVASKGLERFRSSNLLEDSTGRFKGLNLSNPDSLRGKIWRNVVGKTTGGNKVMQAQEAPYILEAEERLSRERARAAQESENIGAFGESVADDIQYGQDKRVGQASADEAGRLAAIDSQEAADVAAIQGSAAANNAEIEAARSSLRQQQAVDSLPVNASPELREMAENVTDPRAFRSQLAKESVAVCGETMIITPSD